MLKRKKSIIIGVLIIIVVILLILDLFVFCGGENLMPRIVISDGNEINKTTLIESFLIEIKHFVKGNNLCLVRWPDIY